MSTEFNKPPSHKNFNLGSITISSDFDSGNLSYAQKVSFSSYDIWIGTDHPEHNYRTWFYFSVLGFAKSHTVNFNIKNMHNQSRLFNQGLLPVYRCEKSQNWKRIQHPINLGMMTLNNEGFLEFTFRHTFQNDQKVYFAFFYPWSLQDNTKLINNLQMECKKNSQIYFNRTVLINSLQGRPVQLITISSHSKITKKQQQIEDKLIFPSKNKPKIFSTDKKAIFISARVHPGQIPSSHVMNGILKKLTKDDQIAKLLRQKFVFYIVPIINPDGVFRGHYRTDKNGINLNRYYINPNPKLHSPIYGIKKFILHLYFTKRFFSCIDLHAHAGRKGMFIYGNYSNELKQQLDICLYPKILSLNSKNFQYEACNFTEYNMYCKDKADSISKEGAARVALYKVTKNPYCWTLECNYNMNRVQNSITQKNETNIFKKFDPLNIDKNLICDYQNITQYQPKSFYTIQTYEKLGEQILDSYLDLIDSHPHSRINNPLCIFQNITNLKLNLIVALMKMTPYHFESNYRKLLTAIQSQKQDFINRSIRALYELFIANQKIQNLQDYLKNDKPMELSMTKSPNKFQRLSLNNELNKLKRKSTMISINSEKDQTKLSQVQSTHQTTQQYAFINRNVSNNEKKNQSISSCWKSNTSEKKEVPNRLKQFIEKKTKQQIIIGSIKQMPTLKVVNLKMVKQKNQNQLILLTNSLNRVPQQNVFQKKVSNSSRDIQNFNIIYLSKKGNYEF